MMSRIIAPLFPDYGSLEDFRTFLDEAHRRGMRVIADLVLNHTSDQHPWFQEARSSPQSAKRDYYVWSDTDKRYEKARIIFIDTEKSNWTWDPVAQAYYWHRFFSHQPDLNYDNPVLQQAMLDVMAFWLDQGLDGFRCDAVPYLIEREGTICENLPETHAYLKEIRKRIDQRIRDASFWRKRINGLPMSVPISATAMNFTWRFIFLSCRDCSWECAARIGIPSSICSRTHRPIPENCQWCLFLRNHDELTLEMCAGEERDYMYYAYARDPLMRRNIGIARRLAPLLDNDRRKIELLNSLVFTLPGSPIIYYGDEIGMGDNVHLGDRNGVRTPMQWICRPKWGIFKGRSLEAVSAGHLRFRLWLPRDECRIAAAVALFLVALDETNDCEAKTATGIRTRSADLSSPEKRQGAWRISVQYRGKLLLLVHNLAGSAQAVELDLGSFEGRVPVELLGESRFPMISKRPYMLSFAPYGYYWFSLEQKPSDDPSYGIEGSVI